MTGTLERTRTLQRFQQDEAPITGKSYLPVTVALGGETTGSAFCEFMWRPALIFFFQIARPHPQDFDSNS